VGLVQRQDFFGWMPLPQPPDGEAERAMMTAHLNSSIVILRRRISVDAAWPHLAATAQLLGKPGKGEKREFV
jgi:hypothetical protein